MPFPYRVSTDEENRAAMRRNLLRRKRTEYLLDEETLEPDTSLLLMRGTINGYGDIVKALLPGGNTCMANGVPINGYGDIVKALLRLLRRKVKMVALDVHGTLVHREECDDFSHARHFREISNWAKSEGLPFVMVSAMPSREGESVARLLDLGGNPAVYELGHVMTTAVLQRDPYISQAVTPEMEDALLDLRRWLRYDILPVVPSVFREPKVVLVSLNTRSASYEEKKWLVDQIEGRIHKLQLPLQISRSDKTVDIGGVDISKITGLRELARDVGLGSIDGQTLAIGDSLNDLDLLEAAGPGLLGCPANSHPEAKAFVQERGGVVSGHPCLGGTIECLLSILWKNAHGEQ